MIKISIFILATILSGVLYRLGGIGKPFNTKYRDFGVPLCGLVSMLFLGIYASWWQYLLYFGLCFGSMTTYNKWASKMIGKDDNSVYGISWFVTGLSYAFAALPVIWGDWSGFIIRCLVVSILTAVWSCLIDTDWLEEGGRGVLVNGTLPLLLI